MHSVEELWRRPDARLFAYANKIETPALLYDIDSLRAIIAAVQSDIAVIDDAKLNLALKACHTPPILEVLRDAGLGCDVASIQEMRLARRVGFTEISSTAPAYSAADLRELIENGVVPDIDSLDQLDLYGKTVPGADVGLRVRVPLPTECESAYTFGRDSRFGLAMRSADDHAAVTRVLAKHGLRLTRLHVHCGQSTSERLQFVARFLLDIAERHHAIDLLDLGGGLFDLYRSRALAQTGLRDLARLLDGWRASHQRKMAIRFEPGGALLGTIGYLVAEARSIVHHEHFDRDIVTVNASAWNLAPWHGPQVVVLPGPTRNIGDAAVSQRPRREALIAGATLYEGDFFGARDPNGGGPAVFTLPQVRPGDRLVFTNSGAYTMTNARRFHRLPLPTEYAFEDGGLTRLGRQPRVRKRADLLAVAS